MLSSHIVLDPQRVVAPVRRELFGSFVEHLGRCVYTGIVEPGHPSANAEGFRGDVLDLVRELGVSTVRYPGGNFVSGYRWEDGVGPVEQRPRRLNLAWHSTEPNTFGTDEFMRWAAAADVEPMMAVNLGTRGIQAASELVEYCNHPGGTTLSDARAANGAPDPYGVRLWCLGNEMDGPWQLGHLTATEYGRLAARTAHAMRLVDPDLTLVACGSSGAGVPTFGDWEREVLQEVYDEVDLISAHSYFFEQDGDLASFLASGVAFDAFLDGIIATVDSVRVARRSAKQINLSVDEWNVWYLNGEASVPPNGVDWPASPALLEDRYNVADGVVVGALLICLLRHADRVAAACQAQLVNVIAPIMTEPGGRAWRQTTFHAFAQASRHARGVVLESSVSSDVVPTSAHGDVAAVDAVATADEDTGDVTVFVVNRSTEEPTELSIDLRAFGEVELRACTVLSDPDPHRVVGVEDADGFAPRPNADVRRYDDGLVVLLPPVSWNVIRVRSGRAAMTSSR